MAKHDFDKLYDDGRDILRRAFGDDISGQEQADQTFSAIKDVGVAMNLYLSSFEDAGFSRSEAMELVKVIVSEVVRSHSGGQG